MIHWRAQGKRPMVRTLAALLLVVCALPASAAEPGSGTRTATARKARPGVSAIRRTQAKARVVTRRRNTRTSRRARELNEAQQAHFTLDDTGALVPDFRAAAAIVYNPETGETLYSQNAEKLRSMASITKVMTASVFLEDNPDLDREVVVERADVRRASTTYIRAGYKLRVGDLLNLLLIGSDNAAARILARVSSFGAQGFIDRMNRDDVVVPHRSRRLSLSQEPLHRLGVRCQMRSQHLDRDIPLELLVVSLQNDPHPSFADRPFDLKVAQTRHGRSLLRNKSGVPQFLRCERRLWLW